MFKREVAVQTDSSYLGNPQASFEGMKIDVTDEDDIGSLSASDLASILKWSKDISSDINLSSGMSSWLSSRIACVNRLPSTPTDHRDRHGQVLA